MNRAQIVTMLQLQDSMNFKVNPNWATAGYPFCRAIVVEGSEAMEHHGWKWWKKQYMDKAQLSMELVDIWHFMLSDIILAAENKGGLAVEIIESSLRSEYQRHGITFDGKWYEYSQLDTASRIELLIGLAVSRRVAVPLFETLLVDVGMSWDDLYRQYVGKNVLNFFRQDHGYREGTYVKLWPRVGEDNAEDNVVLVALMNTLDANSPTFSKDLYAALSKEYAEVQAIIGEGIIT